VYDSLFHLNLDVDPKERPLLVCEPSCNTDEIREKVVALLFEKYEVPAVFIAKDAVLSTFASARSTATVVDCGHGQTTVSSVLDGFLLRGSVVRTPLAGSLLSDAVGAAVAAKGAAVKSRFEFKRIHDPTGGFTVQDLDLDGVTESFKAFQRRAVLSDIKEAVCGRVSDTPLRAEDLGGMPGLSYELPDGQEVELHGERSAIPELLFNPDIAAAIPGFSPPKAFSGEPLAAVPHSVKGAIQKVDVDHQKDMYANVVLVGGTSVMQGMRDRLEIALSELAPITTHGGMRVRVAVPTAGVERRFSTWIGGSILSSLGTFQQMWMSRQEYQEHGAALIHKRAP